MMKKKFLMALGFAVALGGAALVSPVARGEDPPGHFAPWIGRVAPAIALRDLDGKSVALTDYKGKLVVLHFGTSW